MIEPIRVAFSVACTTEHAFDLWTSRTAMWWPLSHTFSAERNLAIVIEPRAGGRIFERTSRGVEHEWGEVIAWDPPHQFSYLWHLKTVRDNATEVDIRFTDSGNGTTQIRIEQRGFDRLGDGGPERREKNELGWNVVIPLFLAACST